MDLMVALGFVTLAFLLGFATLVVYLNKKPTSPMREVEDYYFGNLITGYHL